jgi:hypothetical protein
MIHQAQVLTQEEPSPIGRFSHSAFYTLCYDQSSYNGVTLSIKICKLLRIPIHPSTPFPRFTFPHGTLDCPLDSSYSLNKAGTLSLKPYAHSSQFK